MKAVNKVSEHFLFPSTLMAERSPHRIHTILGSCVSVCLYDIKLRIGGINHYLLPRWNGVGMPSPKFGDIATDLLIDKMKSFGSNTNHVVAKLFGGANQLFQQHKRMSVGAKNIEVAEELLKKYRIEIVGKNIGGTLGRKITFHTTTGQVSMKFLDQDKKDNSHEAIKGFNY